MLTINCAQYTDDMHGQSMLEHMRRRGRNPGPTYEAWGLVQTVQDRKRLSTLFDTPTDHMKLLKSLKAQSQPSSPVMKAVLARAQRTTPTPLVL